eukprot:2815065-Rhodomonas_salina.1
MLKVLGQRMVLCGTCIASGAGWCVLASRMVLCAYGAVRCVVLGKRMELCVVWYWDSVWCYAVCGAGIAYGAM